MTRQSKFLPFYFPSASKSGGVGRAASLTAEQARDIYSRMDARGESGETQQSIADAYGVPQNIVQRIYAGRYYHAATLDLRQQRMDREIAAMGG